MKVVCESCGAKYNVPDEKIRGKVRDIPCKKCDATIHVDGTALAQEDAPAPAEAPQEPTPAAVEDGPWHVTVGEDEQSGLTAGQIEALFMSGLVTAESFAWRDGMDEWKSLGDVEEFAHLVPAAPAEEPPAAEEPITEQEPEQEALAADVPAEDVPSGEAPAAQEEPAAPVEESPAATIVSSAAAGFDVTGGDSDGGNAGLFESFESDAEEESADVGYQSFEGMNAGAGASLDLGGLSDSANDLIAKRSENSVLFSLSSLDKIEAVSPAGEQKEDEKITDGSGLIDIQSLASAHKTISNKGEDPLADLDSPDDGFSGATLSVPAVAPRKKESDNKGLIVTVVVLALLLVGGGIAAAIVFSNQDQGGPPVVYQEKVIERIIEKEVPADTKASDAEKTGAAAIAAADKAEKEDEKKDDEKSSKRDRKRRRDRDRDKSKSGSDKADSGTAVASKSDKPKSDIDAIVGGLDKKKKDTSNNSSIPDPGLGGSTNTNKLTKSDVQRTIRKYNGRINACASSSNTGKLSGTVNVKFTITESGRVNGSALHPSASKFKGTDVGKCVIKVVSAMKFPASSDKTPIAKYPFILP